MMRTCAQRLSGLRLAAFESMSEPDSPSSNPPAPPPEAGSPPGDAAAREAAGAWREATPTLTTAPVRPRDRIYYERVEEALPHLPPYSRSLLKIKTPVRVTLATTRLAVRQIIELAPGSLIQFPKSCEEALELEVGDQVIARGEAVKVGEKFGLRITAMVLPGERFAPIAPPRTHR